MLARLSTLALIGSWSPAAPASDTISVTAFVGVGVVPMDRERVLDDQTVIVRDGRIQSIGPSSAVAVPAGAIRVDGRGKFLLPGLADLHAHLRDNDGDNSAQLRLFLANGVTTIVSLRGTPAHLDVRRRVASGELLGPTVYTSGPFVNEPEFKTPEDVERAVVEQKKAGYDFIKMHGTMSRPAYQRLFEVARREGIRVIGHAPRNLPFMVVLAEHQDAVAHAEEYVYTYFDFRFDHPQNPDTLGDKVATIAAATARAGVSVIPTLVAFHTIKRQVDDICEVLARPEVRLVPPNITRNWQPQSNTYVKRFKQSDGKTFEAMYRLQASLVKAMQTAGVRLLAGTDATIPSVVPGTSLHEELERMVAAGLSPYEALRTATYNAADFLHGLEQFGTVADGKRADLILVDGNPLDRIENTARLSGVMARGRWFPKSALQSIVDSLTASYPREAPTVAASALPRPTTPLRITRGSAASTTAFVDVAVLPMDTNRVLERQTVIVQAGRITAMGPARSTRVPADATRIDAKGRYLMPGLAEMHAHLVENDADNRAFLEQYLANGVTTILNMRGTPTHLALRGQVATGEVLGPTIFTTGPFVNEPFATTPDEVEAAVVAQKKAGYDFVKMHGDLTREAYRRLFEAARREGIRVVGHAPRNLPFEVMSEERQETVVHVEEYLYVYFTDPMKDRADLDERTARIPYMASAVARAGTWLIPTLTVFRGLPEQVDNVCAVMARPESKYVQPNVLRNWLPSNNNYLDRFGVEDAKRLWRQYGFLEKTVKAFHQAGVRLLAGTDPPVPSVVAGFALHLELEYLVAAGLTPYDALRAATYDPADFLHRLNESGTVAVGKRADLLLLDANPLADIRNTRSRAGTMVNGRWLSQADLQKILDDRVAAYRGRAG